MNESHIFTNALKFASPGERAAYLDEACAGNPELRAGVEALLRARASDPDFLEQPPGSLADTADAPAAAGSATGSREPVVAEEAGAVLSGRYKLLEPIGEGGMGTVWMAQQTEPVKRLVAVKLIKPGMDSKQVLARFEAERQALALMDHPNIARVLDGGATASSRPYFVMDLVKGVPITRYCDEHHLTPRQRLELFVPVCQAVQHAHQKGIIHRDLKPSNVLVALYDGKPVPKVIDFGVAKAAGQPLTEKTLVTGFGNIVGTLEYMSPEQAEVNQLDIDTRSDIYSLGVLLYELLAGSTPFSRKDLEKAGMLEMLRVIREQEPSKPSTKLSTAEGLPTLAANRGMEPAKLTRLVRGELDWIVMKALEKNRSRRYETANGLARDLQRHLADEVVEARPPSAGYRFRKFVRRNRGRVVASSLVLLVLGGGIIGRPGADPAADACASRQRANQKQVARSRPQKSVRDALAAPSGPVGRFSGSQQRRTVAPQPRPPAGPDERLRDRPLPHALPTIAACWKHSSAPTRHCGAYGGHSTLRARAVPQGSSASAASLNDRCPTHVWEARSPPGTARPSAPTSAVPPRAGGPHPACVPRNVLREEPEGATTRKPDASASRSASKSGFSALTWRRVRK